MHARTMNLRTAALTCFALVAFASNSILCRLALAPLLVDAGTFTLVRLLSGALTLAALLAIRDRSTPKLEIQWSNAVALCAYALPFSFAYLRISAGTGALILFGAVQATMIGCDLLRGKSLYVAEFLGLVLAITGLVVLTWPGTAAPDLFGAVLMAIAGVAWGVYSLKGRGVSDPLAATAGAFALSLVLTAPLAAVTVGRQDAFPQGLILAIASGAIASGVGYAVWYAALRGLSATQAGIVQLLVPVLAALGGVAILGETVSLRLILSGAMVFAGVTLSILGPGRQG